MKGEKWSLDILKKKVGIEAKKAEELEKLTEYRSEIMNKDGRHSIITP
jgi:hypothetical protein